MGRTREPEYAAASAELRDVLERRRRHAIIGLHVQRARCDRVVANVMDAIARM
jgi:hypothetical protein